MYTHTHMCVCEVYLRALKSTVQNKCILIIINTSLTPFHLISIVATFSMTCFSRQYTLCGARSTAYVISHFSSSSSSVSSLVDFNSFALVYTQPQLLSAFFLPFSLLSSPFFREGGVKAEQSLSLTTCWRPPISQKVCSSLLLTVVLFSPHYHWGPPLHFLAC